MPTSRSRHLMFLVALLALTVTLSSCGGSGSTGSTTAPTTATAVAAPTPTPTPTRTTPDVNALVSGLQVDGFTVQQGSVQAVDLLTAVSNHLLPSAFGNNASGIYFPVVLPAAPHEAPAAGQTPGIGYDPNDPTNFPASPNFYPPGGSYKLRADEAVVYITRTPPSCTYFGYVGYVGLTQNLPGKDYSGVMTTGNDTVGYYHRIFGSLGDTIDHLRIKTDGTGTSFNALTVMVYAADRGVAQRVHRALLAAGYPASIVNDFVFPSTMVKMGLEKGKDTFVILGRATIFDDAAAGQAWADSLPRISQVYRITPNAPVSADPYPFPSVIGNGSGTTEEQVLPGEQADLEQMRANLIQTYGTSAYTYQDLTTSLWIPWGFTGYDLDRDCLADNRDALYLRTNDFQLQSDQDFVVCYGVNHDVTGYTAYGDICAYGAEYLNGVASGDSVNYPGTAAPFLPGSTRSNSYYVYRVARNVDHGQPAVIVPKSTGNPRGFAFGIDNGQPMFLCWRKYCDPHTGVAPAMGEVTWDHALLFTHK